MDWIAFAALIQSDVVYTFLHCLPRDEQDKARMQGSSESATTGTGKPLTLTWLFTCSRGEHWLPAAEFWEGEGANGVPE